MEISVKDFSEMKAILSSLTKTLKNFDDRLDAVESDVAEVAETVTVELPKAIAEQVESAVGAAVADSNNETPAETTTVEETTEVCPTCGQTPCTCETTETTEGENTAEEKPAEGDAGNFSEVSFEEFSQKVTETIEDLTVKTNDIAERVNKMFVKVFSEGDAQINDVTEDETDVTKVEEGLKEDSEFVTEEDPQITGTGDIKTVAQTEVKVEETPVVEAPAVTTVEVEKPADNFSAKDRYSKVRNIFNF